MDGPEDEHVLVTGGAGFIGSHLAHALVEHNAVTVVDALTGGDRERVPDAATFVEADIRDDERIRTLVADVDRIFHQAARVSVEDSIRAPDETHDVNVAGTVSVLEAARAHDVPVVLASSAAIYGDPGHVPIAEDDPVHPLSPYGLEKLAVDEYARLYHELYGLEAVALRYFNVYGPHQTASDYAGVITTFLDQARRDEPITIEGDGTQTRDFVNVADVVRANLLAATTPEAAGRAFNVGTGMETSIAELAEIVTEAVETESTITHVDPRPGDIQRSAADLSRAREVLGFEPSVDLADGLRAMTGE